MKLRNIIFLFLFFVTANNIYCQKIDSTKSKTFKYYERLLDSSTYNVFENSQKLLENAQTKYEVTLAYWRLGGSMYRKSEYANAIFYLEKAEQVGKDLNLIDFQWEYVNLLSNSYRRAGLISQSNDMWEKEMLLYKKSKDKLKDATYYYNLSKRNDIDENYCQSSVARRKYLSLVPKAVQKNEKDYLFATYSQLAFSDLKCGNEKQAQESLLMADEYLGTNPKKNASLVEIYDVTNAILQIRKGNINEGKQLFDEAYEISKIKETATVTKLILTERLGTNIDSPEIQLGYTKEIEEIRNLETTVNKNLVLYETEKTKKIITKQKNRTTYWIVASILFVVSLISIYLYMAKRNRKLKSLYLQIPENIDSQKKEANSETEKKSSQIIVDKEICDDSQTKELENEHEIVNKLKIIENKEFYLSKNVSAAQMAVMLKITPRNLAYILKKYRNEDFYNYLNTIRINYISKELQANPKLLQYKIAALADLCGYSSHSQFATIFKAKTGISPSQYIQFLQKER